jgi:hypothetical protein
MMERELDNALREVIDLRATVQSQEQMIKIQNEAIVKLQSERDRFMRSASEVSMLCENVSDMLAKGLRRFLMNEASRDDTTDTPLFLRKAMEQTFARGHDRVESGGDSEPPEDSRTPTAEEFFAHSAEALNASETSVVRPRPMRGTARTLPAPRLS